MHMRRVSPPSASATPLPSPSASSCSSPLFSSPPTSAADPPPPAAAANQQSENSNPNRSNENSIYLPRIIFVAEDDENESQNVVVGLDQAVINSYPKLVFSKRSGNWGNDTVCAICLCEYRESEMLRMLPDCKHCFHVTCVDAWLKLNASCPVCRNSPLPTPLSTPLQEVVPLSQYSDGRRRQ
ncbi:UNVERIFIED_CONTAM: RING-H2 finger protein ATL67 [Sesamum radiatum]|uniref:RING-H2 finger protein ATL67 n=1 Tax=Sesamum radiatum TaxID=300843 RepID=A0AAW2R1K4_SESRA